MSAFTTSSGKRRDLSNKLKLENVAQTKEETKNLEMESRKMEERLHELKMAMSREKEERERANFKGYWKTGALGKLSDYGTEALGKHAVKQHKEAKKPTIKVLKAEPEKPKAKKTAAPGTMAFIAQKGMPSNSAGTSKKNHGKKCGQCEVKGAHVSCMECGEDYCAQCFASFHMKGALKKHRSIPIVSAMTPRTPRSMDPIIAQPDPPPKETNPMKVTLSEIDFDMAKEEEGFYSGRGDGDGGGSSNSNNGGSLLNGDYNEADAAAEFQAALREWRGGQGSGGQGSSQGSSGQGSSRQSNGHGYGHQPAASRPVVSPVRTPPVSTDSATGTETTTGQPKVDIHFTSNLSYAEKLLLKKHRRSDLASLDSSATPPATTPSVLSDSTPREDSGDLDLRGSIDPGEHVDFGAISSAVALLRAGSRAEVPEDPPERSESRVSIVDWNEQPKKKSRNMEHSSTYEVVEMSTPADYSSIPNEWKHPDDRKIAFGSPVNPRKDNLKHSPTPPLVHTPTPPSTPTSGRASYSSKGRRLKLADEKVDKTSDEKTAGKNVNGTEQVKDVAKTPVPSTKSNTDSPAKRRKDSDGPKPKPKPAGNKTPVPATPSEKDRDFSPRKTWTKDFTILDDFKKTLDDLRKKEQESEKEEQKAQKSARGQRSRPSSARSRPQSSRRPKSRAQTRLELFGEGTLTKGPSDTLKQIASMRPSGPSAAPPRASSPRGGLAGFFLAGVPPAPQEPRTLTPTALKSARGEKGKEGKGWKISNKVYQLGPRSWRPESSLGDTVPDAEAQAHLDTLMPTYRDFLLPSGPQDYGAAEGSLKGEGGFGGFEARKVEGMEFTLSEGVKERSSVGRVSPSPMTATTQNAPKQDGRQRSDVRPKTPLKTTPRQTSARLSQKPLHKPSPRGVTRERTGGRVDDAGPMDSARSQSRPESRMIVVDGDDMSRYDDRSGESDDDDALEQLEWELASQTGRVQDDGKVSRLELPLEDDDPDSDLDPMTGRDLITPVNCTQDAGFDIDTKLSASDLMDNFEELEDQLHDEEEVQALR